MGPVLSTTVALLAVCGLAVAVLRLLGQRAPSVRGLRVVARLPLDARRALFVVEAGGRVLLLGAGDGGLTLLTELERGAAGEAVAPISFPGPPTASSRLRRSAPLDALKRAIGLP